MHKRFLSATVLCLALTACQSIPESQMPPNKFVFNADKTTTKEAIIATFLPEGYQITKDSEFQLVLDKKITNSFGASLVYGSNYNVNPNARVTLTITGNKPTTVNSQISMITNPGSGFERINEIDANQEGRSSIARAMEKAQTLIKK